MKENYIGYKYVCTVYTVLYNVHTTVYVYMFWYLGIFVWDILGLLLSGVAATDTWHGRAGLSTKETPLIKGTVSQD